MTAEHLMIWIMLLIICVLSTIDSCHMQHIATRIAAIEQHLDKETPP